MAAKIIGLTTLLYNEGMFCQKIYIQSGYVCVTRIFILIMHYIINLLLLYLLSRRPNGLIKKNKIKGDLTETFTKEPLHIISDFCRVSNAVFEPYGIWCHFL